MSISRNDVAKEAGVSPTTVSFILNNKIEHFNPLTVKKVRDAAKKLGYTPNKIAQALKTGKSNIIVMWVYRMTSMYTSTIIKYTQEYLQEAGYDVIVKDVRKLHNFTNEMIVDGILAFDCLDYTLLYKKEVQIRLPIVSVGKNIVNSFDNVSYDLSDGVLTGLTSFVKKGYKKIGFLYVSGESENDVRYNTYKDFIKKNGLKEYILKLDDQFDDIKTEKNIKECPFLKDLDAILSHNDFNSFRFIKIVKDLGINVPKDLKLISTDNVSMSNYYIPTLSTVEIPIKSMCRTAVDFLINRIKDPNIPVQEKVYVSSFIERESSI
ncbi:MAG: LacI family DNA-binding transcriptional regulator [Abditibacteriota bacterium]|nr:LacI family DNA-binding transcriptional regulator [Abditibacteriota bacterium]